MQNVNIAKITLQDSSNVCFNPVKVDLSTPPQGSRVCVRAKYWLASYCMLNSLSFDMQRELILKKLFLAQYQIFRL